jgi:hypothetical protein
MIGRHEIGAGIIKHDSSPLFHLRNGVCPLRASGLSMFGPAGQAGRQTLEEFGQQVLMAQTVPAGQSAVELQLCRLSQSALPFAQKVAFSAVVTQKQAEDCGHCEKFPHEPPAVQPTQAPAMQLKPVGQQIGLVVPHSTRGAHWQASWQRARRNTGKPRQPATQDR